MTDLIQQIHQKAQGSTDAPFWRQVATEIERLRNACTSYEIQANRDALEIERLRAALVMAREALPRRDSLPNTKTRIGDIIDAVDAAIATQAPGDVDA